METIFTGATTALLLFSQFWLLLPFGQGTPFGNFEVRSLKRGAKHLETAALICALRLEGESEALVAEAWKLHFSEGANKDDQLLVNTTVHRLCKSK